MKTKIQKLEEFEDEFDKQMKQYFQQSQNIYVEICSEGIDQESSIFQCCQYIQNDKNFLNKPQKVHIDEEIKKQKKSNKVTIRSDKKIKKQELEKINVKVNTEKVIHPHNRLYSCQQLRKIQQKKFLIKPQWNSYFVNTKKKLGSYGFGNNQNIKEALKKKSSIINISEPLTLNIIERLQNWKQKKNRDLLEKSRKKYHKERQFCSFKPRIIRS